MKRTISALFLAMAVTLGVVIAPTTSSTPITAALVSPAAAGTTTPARIIEPLVQLLFERRVLALTNQRRAAAGCRPLVLNTNLRRAAREHARAMARARTMAHQLPGEPSLARRLTIYDYLHWSVAAENIAAGYLLPINVMNAWMRSPGHRRNILDCRLKELGVGVVLYGLRLWWTQDFGTRRS